MTLGMNRQQRAEAKCLEVDQGSAVQDPGIGCHEQGLEAAGVQVCGQHDLLRLHASRGHGERSLVRMFPTWRTVEVGKEAVRRSLPKRKVYAEVPPRVDYDLTPLGRVFLEPVTLLCAWAQTHKGNLEAALAKRKKGCTKK